MIKGLLGMDFKKKKMNGISLEWTYFYIFIACNLELVLFKCKEP